MKFGEFAVGFRPNKSHSPYYTVFIPKYSI